jgi:ABC-type antimicrobial peptide transport system permease subunit
VSHNLWRSGFGGDPAIVGRTLTVSGNPVTIVGVAAAGFLFPAGGALPATGMPVDTQPDVLRLANANVSVNVIGRLAPGHTPASATGELLPIFKHEAGARFRGESVEAINPNIVINEISTMNARVAVAMRGERDSAVLFGVFALAALVMAAIGVYGVAAYAIAQRTKEIGIRVALGAARHDVRRLILSQTLWPTLIGLVVGVAAAGMLTRLVASMVYGVTPLDPATFVAAVVVLLSVALAATWMPARRAMRIDPLVALRYE